jgi:tRNA pseudouridine55 synthase
MPSGVLLLDKPLGLSSNAALQRVRTLFGRVKGGHVGRLDPLASGMLPICLGEATKVAGDLLAGRKCYRFSVALGSATATGDTEGTVTLARPVPPLSAPLVTAVLQRFLGVLEQVPPMYSAIKQDGQPLYRLARAGVSVPRAPRRIEIFALTLRGFTLTHLDLEVLCSKGTYVRVLAADIAEELGTVGHVASLRRLYVEPFAEQTMHTLESLQGLAQRAEVPPLLPIDAALTHLPALTLNDADRQRLLRGQRVASGPCAAAPRVRLYGPDGGFLGLGEVDGAGGLQPRRLLVVAAPHSAPDEGLS